MADDHVRCTYNDVHKLIAKASERIQSEFKPDVIIAIGGGFLPCKSDGGQLSLLGVCGHKKDSSIDKGLFQRTFLKDPSTKKNIPIQAIGLSLYESLPGTTEEQLGQVVLRTQWLGPSKALLGRRALIVDEVDDSRTTLHYAVTELKKDVETELLKLPEAEREAAKTQFAIFVVHNKLKSKAHTLPEDVPYYPGAEVEDVWLDYPWEMKDIDEHDRKAAMAR